MKKYLFVTLVLLSCGAFLSAQNIGIGTVAPDASALLDISDPAKGMLIPRMTTASVSNIQGPAKGLMVFDSTLNELMVNMGTPSAPNWRTMAYNSSWNVKGNGGINPAVHFIGTTDNKPLLFRMNNKPSGKIDSVGFHTFYGYRSGISATGVDNTAFGYKAMHMTNTGQSNSAFGSTALHANTTGNNNTAIGNQALKVNTSGNHNVAVGHQAVDHNTTGSLNTGVGTNALNFNTSGGFNTAIGTAAMLSNTTGHSNTAIGSDALRWTKTSSNNTMLGYGAGQWNDMGWNNTLIGAGCNVNASGIFNSVAIGNAITITASNQARIGNSSTNSIGGFAGWTNFSDGRYKKNVQEDVKGLDFIMKLRPVTYQLDVTGLRMKLNESNEDLNASGMDIAIAQKESMIQSGFIAQEVEEAARSLGYDFSGVDKPKNKEDFYGLRYAEFVVPMIKAMQEQQQLISDLQKQVAELSVRMK